MKNTNKQQPLGVIRKKQDFKLLRKKGRVLREKGSFIVYRKNEETCTRIALFFPKWTGNAVRRNRFRRWAKCFIREQEWPESLDCLIGFEKKPKDFYQKINYQEFYSNFKNIYERLK